MLYPTDIGHFKDICLDVPTKRFIIENGYRRQTEPFVKYVEGRSVLEKYYPTVS